MWVLRIWPKVWHTFVMLHTQVTVLTIEKLQLAVNTEADILNTNLQRRIWFPCFKKNIELCSGYSVNKH
jgi:hypothetical protein